MGDGNHESGVGLHRILIDPVKVGVDARRRPEEPQRLVDQVATDITKQPALRASLQRGRVVGVEPGVESPDVARC